MCHTDIFIVLQISFCLSDNNICNAMLLLKFILFDSCSLVPLSIKYPCFYVHLPLYRGVGADAKNQLLVVRSLANSFSKCCGAQFMVDEQKWVRLSSVLHVTLCLNVPLSQ